MEAGAQTMELRDAPLPDGLIPSFGMWPWWLGSIIAAVLALVIWLLLRRRAPTAMDPLKSRARAYAEADAALAAPDPAAGARDAAVQASLILRKYLSLAASDPALFETHEEFIARHDALTALTPPARTAAATGFARLAALKYGPEEPSADPAAIRADARALLKTLHHGFAA